MHSDVYITTEHSQNTVTNVNAVKQELFKLNLTYLKV